MEYAQGGRGMRRRRRREEPEGELFKKIDGGRSRRCRIVTHIHASAVLCPSSWLNDDAKEILYVMISTST